MAESKVRVTLDGYTDPLRTKAWATTEGVSTKTHARWDDGVLSVLVKPGAATVLHIKTPAGTETVGPFVIDEDTPLSSLPTSTPEPEPDPAPAPDLEAVVADALARIDAAVARAEAVARTRPRSPACSTNSAPHAEATR